MCLEACERTVFFCGAVSMVSMEDSVSITGGGVGLESSVLLYRVLARRMCLEATEMGVFC